MPRPLDMRPPMPKDTVVHHSADYDGIFSREIARKFLPDAELIGWDFGQAPLPFPAEGAVYVIDLPVDQPFGVKFHDGRIGSGGPLPLERVIWIDHHKSAIDSHPKGLDGYRIDGVAACRLAWQWFNAKQTSRIGDLYVGTITPLPNREMFVRREVSEPLAVQWAGEYDVWDHRDDDADVAFQFGLDSQEELRWPMLLDLGLMARQHAHAIVFDGRKAMQCYKTRDAEIMRSRSFMAEFEGLNFLCLNTARCNSNTFAERDKPETGHDALLAFYWTGKLFSVSLYHAAHRRELDLSLIAVKHGGGGHRGACGFRTVQLSFIHYPEAK